ncbi:hypothetical protein C5167_050588 [Papaver somniferum]|uniref:Uncharacterized protein n=1 Tax=Papaver somniferum TaxID=3469 RepID=A0A4Y7KTB4_PAPSO|nr:hypothetical protein C5167_050588 [Papaver somniferum]
MLLTVKYAHKKDFTSLMVVLLRCRKADLNLVNIVFYSAEQEYASKAGVHELEILVDNDVFLPPAPSHHSEH